MTYLELALRARRGTSSPTAPSSDGTSPNDLQNWDEAALAQTVVNLRRLAAAELADYRAELASAAPDDPWLAFDQEALRRLERTVYDDQTAR